MFSSKTLLSLIFFTLSAVDASPLTRQTGPATLSFATRVNQRGASNIAEVDRARVQAMKQGGDGSVSVTNIQVTYTIEMGIGEPATYYTLLIDTGSSNTWIGSNKTYIPTSASHDTGNAATASYGSGYFYGEEWTDTVTLSPELVIKNQSIGVASQSGGFAGLDGVFGAGPVGLTAGTVNNTGTVPTPLDNLYAQGTISQEVLGVYYVPSSERDSTGELTFGDYDNGVTSGPMGYVPLTKTSPASKYWGFNQSVTYGDETILSMTAGIVDTGTTLVLLATDAYQKYQNVTGGVMDYNTGLLALTSEQYANLKALTFNIGGTSYDLTPNAQIWPRALNEEIGGNSSGIYLMVGDIGTPSGQGLDFTNGYVFLERFYSVYDTTNQRVGFSRTAYTDSTPN